VMTMHGEQRRRQSHNWATSWLEEVSNLMDLASSR
jgi:hypothetical protein